MIRSTTPPPRPLRAYAAHAQPAAQRLALVAALILGFAATAAAQSYRVPAGYSTEVVQVKLEEGRSPSEINAVLPSNLRADAARVRPLFTVAPERLAQFKAEGERRTGRTVKDLRLWFEVRLAPGTDAAAFIEALRATPGVEAAEPAPLPAPPPSAPRHSGSATGASAGPAATTPSFVASQGYLGEAPDGVDAEFAWTIPGGNGAGVTIYDVEYDWNQTHEDLSKAEGVALLLPAGHTKRSPFDSNDHGTAVLGEVIADNDDKGVTGISWGADVGLAPTATFDENGDPAPYNPANAILLAAADAGVGDVILIEAQTSVCGLGGCNSTTQNGCGPLEWIDSVYDAIESATGAGIVVVAAAGNGNVDLDQDACDDKFDRGTRDSGAIVVGAGAAPGASDRERLGFSSYGGRVDVQGWGQSVWTTGYGNGYTDPDDPSNPDRWYDNGFGGTSSASPIVTGAVANLQGIRAAAGDPYFSSTQVRQLLVDTGSPQQGDLTEHIGPRPNLLMAIASFMNVPPVADAGPDQTLECAAPTGTEVTLDGTGTTDANGDALTYTWRENGNQIATGATPTVAFALGTHTVELTVDDGKGGTDTDLVVITVEDTTDPVVTLIGPSEITIECNVGNYFELGATADDLCEGGLAVTITGEVDTETPGVYEVTYTATDGSGNEGTATRTVEVVDTTPPDFMVHSDPMSLWPPNHKYRPVDLDDLDMTVEDLCDLTVGPDDVLITAAASDEAEEVPDPGDGETYEDIVIAEACRSVEVRAERAMYGNGRVYTLALAVADASGNVSEDDYEAHIPINARVSPWAVADSPALYTVEGCAVVEEALAEAPDAAETADASEGGDAGKGAPEAGEAPAAGSTAALPTEYELHQNYPNPFRSVAEVTFGLPEPAEVRLVVYDVLGREVAVLVDGSLGAGTHRVTFDASGLRSGTYIYRMEAGPAAHVRHMVLMR